MPEDCFHGGMKFDDEVDDFVYTCEMDGCRDPRCPYNIQEENKRYPTTNSTSGNKNPRGIGTFPYPCKCIDCEKTTNLEEISTGTYVCQHGGKIQGIYNSRYCKAFVPDTPRVN